MFPPEGIEMPMWAKLHEDKAKGIAIVWHKNGDPWWPLLLEVKMGHFARITAAEMTIPTGCDRKLKKNHLEQLNYVIVAFDFGYNLTPSLLFPGHPPQASCTHMGEHYG